MNYLHAIIFGIVQGFTEFFPISSSGHLAILHNLIGGEDIALDVVLHLATLLAVIIFLLKDIKSIFKDFFTLNFKSQNFKMALFIVTATIPVAVIGFLFRKIIERTFFNLQVIALGFLISGIFLFFASNSNFKSRLNFKKSFVIGIAQALAILPGISRSGSTISTGLLLGLERKKAIKFSFLLAIPAIIGANLLEFKEITKLNIAYSLVGFSFAFFSALLALFLLFKYVKVKNLKYFAYYCWLLAVLLLISAFIF